jgi:acetoacetyl-CoA synthetase
VKQPIWRPDRDALGAAAISRFAWLVNERHGVDVEGYLDLWSWSVENLEAFWRLVWDFFDVQCDGAISEVLAGSSMPGAQWFPGVRLNYAEHALRAGADSDLAVTEVREDGTVTRTTWGELRRTVAAVAQWLSDEGVVPGDRVVGYLPNTTHTLVAFLATASVGAIWSACAQDYSASGAASRFAQLEPVVLFAADGYLWNGQVHDRRAEADSLRRALPSVRTAVNVPNIGLPVVETQHDVVPWADICARPSNPHFLRVSFDTPLWVLFSSGTTGLPKGICHGHGGVLLEHLKQLGLQFEVGPGRPFFWYTSTNWMMWNLTVSGLLVGAPIVLYDGSPTHPGPRRLWEIAADNRVAVLGVSPGYLLASAKAGLRPGVELGLSALRVVGATGAPVPASSYWWIAEAVSPRVQLASVSGGTDVVSGFAGSAPTTEVWPGEISAPALGVALASWDAGGKPLVGAVGELVVTKPMPSMPVCFWADPDGTRYRDAYFSTYPGVWRHGDWIEITDRGSVVISGRSDSTLNRNGVRLGSADIYSVVDRLREIQDSLVIGAEMPGGGYWLVLFVVLANRAALDEVTVQSLKSAIATNASPRHVPDDIIAVPALPHTRTGKKLEVPVKRLIQGQPLEKVASCEAVDDYDALAYFTSFAGSWRG